MNCNPQIQLLLCLNLDPDSFLMCKWSWSSAKLSLNPSRIWNSKLACKVKMEILISWIPCYRSYLMIQTASTSCMEWFWVIKWCTLIQSFELVILSTRFGFFVILKNDSWMMILSCLWLFKHLQHIICDVFEVLVDGVWCWFGKWLFVCLCENDGFWWFGWVSISVEFWQGFWGF